MDIDRERDKETENFLLLQQGSKLPSRSRVTDTGKLKEKRKAKKIAEKNKKASRSILGAHNLFVNPEEKAIYNEHWTQGRAMVIERKGELNFADEVLLTDFCVARLRQFRKTRLESHFNRFMDRQCPQDPIGQSISILKALGLTSDKDKSTVNTKELYMKLLGKESENNNSTEETRELTFEEWQLAQSTQEITVDRYTPSEIAVYDNEIIDATPEPKMNKTDNISA
jgi:hypothetical protein